MYAIRATGKFKKDLKRLIKQGRDIGALETVVMLLAHGETLPEKYKDHSLKSNWVGFRDCHIQPDWVLIYKVDAEVLTLTLTRTGSHSELEL
jgi:mRNA interferase YafQ